MKKPSHKILLTGASGFVGRHLARTLLNEGHELYLLVRNPAKLPPFHGKVHLLEGGLEDMDFFQDTLPQDLTATIHCAGLLFTREHKDFYRINTEASLKLYRSTQQRSPGSDFIYLSSIAALGPSTSSPDEDSPPRPISHYGRSKLHAEMLLKKNQGQGRLFLLRPPLILGPEDQAMLDFFQMIRRGWLLSLSPQRTEQPLSFVYVQDLVHIILNLLNNPSTPSGTYFCAHPKAASLAQLGKLTQKLLQGPRLRRLHIPRWSHPLILPLLRSPWNQSKLTPDKFLEASQSGWTCSSQKIRQALKFDFEFDLDRALALTLASESDELKKLTNA